MFKKLIVGSFTVMMLFQAAFITFAAESESTTSQSSSTTNQETQYVESSDKEVTNYNTSLEGYTFMSDNEFLELYVNESNLAIKVVNKESGYVWSSALHNPESYDLNETWTDFAQSAITIEYLNPDNELLSESITTAPAEVTVAQTDNGFTSTVKFPEGHIELTLNVSLEENDVVVEIPKESIIESDEYKLVSISLYPFLGATFQDNVPGYMFIPDGSGALIRYGESSVTMTTPYSAQVYGNDEGISPEEYSSKYTKPAYIASIPVFGVVHGEGQNAMMATIEDGDNYATIQASIAGLSTGFNWINSKFTYRSNYNQPTRQNETGEDTSIEMFQEEINDFNVKVRYSFLDGEDASYVGMANEYQASLIEQGVLTKQDGEESPIMRLEFLGGEIKEGLVVDSVVVMTPVDKVLQYVEDLAEQGVTDVMVVYKGWTDDGLSASSAENTSIEKKLGSKEDFKDVSSTLEEMGVPMYFYMDYLKKYDSAKVYGNTDMAEQINQMPIEMDAKTQYPYYAMHPTTALENATDSVEDFEKYDINYFALDSIGYNLYSSHNDGGELTRSETESTYQELIAVLNEGDTSKTALYQPNANMWQTTEVYLDVPMYSSGYLYVTDTVPFIQIVLKGCVDYYAPFTNFWSDPKQDLLRMIDYGAYPSFYLTAESPNELATTASSDLYTSEYEVWEETIVKVYNIVDETLGQVKGETIVARDVLADGVVKVTYSNDVSIYINYNDVPYEAEGLTVGAENYAVVKGASSNE